MAGRKTTPEQRFWKAVAKSDSCWLWTKSTDTSGYGHISVNSKQIPTHRFAYRLLVGEIPKGKILMHSCDTPRCVNPAHLSVGTRADNRADCVRKCRHAVGVANGKSRLRPEQIPAIRSAEGTIASIAKTFGVSMGTIDAVRSHRTWRHV